MSSADFLSRIEKVQPTGHGRWLACCPAHDDRHASLAIRELDDGRTLVHCFAGCNVHEILAAAGLDMEALFPEKRFHHRNPEHRPFPASDVLRAVAFEVLIVCAASSMLQAGKSLSDSDHSRLILASSRIQAALVAGGLGHE